MDIRATEIKLIPITEIKPNPKNPNKHTDDQIERLIALFKETGFRVPLVISNFSGLLAAGHGRLEALKRMKVEHVPVMYQDFKDESEEYAFVCADNAIAEWSHLAKREIQDEVKNLKINFPEFNMDLLGFKEFKLPEVRKFFEKDPDSIGGGSFEPVAKPGDVWILGAHRLMCGDSTIIDGIEKLMAGKKANLVFTSPPYNANESLEYNDGKKRFMYADKDSDNKSPEEYLQFIRDIFSSIFMATEEEANVLFNINYNANSESEYIKVINNAIEDGWFLRETIAWKKNGMPAGGYHMTRTWEPIFFLTKHENKYFQNKTDAERFFNFWEISNNGAQHEEHRACFPVKLPELAIERYCPKDGLLFEPFAGSGTTFIAAEMQQRVCYGMEIDPRYCDIIIKRWQGFTEREAILESTGKTYEQTKEEGR